LVTVAIPVRNGGALLDDVLEMVAAQSVEHELLICDSGSSDGSVERARAAGADVFSIPPEQFSHGGTRNLLMERASGSHVAFLTQDAVPADEHWLARLLEPFEAGAGIGLSFGPYRPRPDASPMVARELATWFASLPPGAEWLAPGERDLPVAALHGRRGFFTDANGCVSRAAWEEVPFRPVAYAEDHVLAHDMLRAGYGKVYVPEAAVIHSHEYSGWGWLRRSFDEARAVRAVYGLDEAGRPGVALRRLRGGVAGDLRAARADGGTAAAWRLAAASVRHHGLRGAGTVLGVRADRLPAAVVRRLSGERRAN
jgi:rhamnosyltransferase